MTLRPIDPELYRCYYVCDEGSPKREPSFDPRRLVPWEHILTNERGRWDDPLDEYRVLYAADAEVTAFVEVLADLRPSRKTHEDIAAIDDADDGLSEEQLLQAAQARAQRAVVERLRPRYTALLTTSARHMLYDVLHGASRSEIERHFGLRPNSLKTGHFTTVDTVFTRRVSRFVYETTRAVGIHATSAEAGGGYIAALLETGNNTDVLRAAPLHVGWAEEALRREHAIERAQQYLGILPSEVPSREAGQSLTQ